MVEEDRHSFALILMPSQRRDRRQEPKQAQLDEAEGAKSSTRWKDQVAVCIGRQS